MITTTSISPVAPSFTQNYPFFPENRRLPTDIVLGVPTSNSRFSDYILESYEARPNAAVELPNDNPAIGMRALQTVEDVLDLTPQAQISLVENNISPVANVAPVPVSNQGVLVSPSLLAQQTQSYFTAQRLAYMTANLGTMVTPHEERIGYETYRRKSLTDISI